MRRRFPTGLKVFLIIASVFLTIYGFLFIQVARAVTWKVHDDLTDKQKSDFSEMARMPGMASAIERYGIKGWQDAEYLIETYRYDSVDALCNAMPDGCSDSIRKTLETGTPTSEKDAAGKRMKRYDVAYGLPLISDDEAREMLTVYEYGAFHDYYIYEYSDGTYRFAADVAIP